VALGPIRGIATDAAGNLLISVSQALQKVDARGALTTLVGLGNSGVEGSPSRVSGAAFGVAVDTAGNIYFSALGMVRRIVRANGLSRQAGHGVFHRRWRAGHSRYVEQPRGHRD
jgi:hypothetical protein